MLFFWLRRRRFDCPHPRNAIYEWLSSGKWYAHAVVPSKLRIRARPEDSADGVLACLPPTIRRFLFQIDLSDSRRFPAGRTGLLQDLAARGIQPVNARVSDIRKRTVQQACRGVGLPCAQAPPAGPPSELLIVKTDCNYGGRMERKLSRKQLSALALDTPPSIIRGPFGYLVRPRRDIPPHFWNDPGLWIERFIDNADHRIWRARLSLGRFVFSSGRSPRPVKKLAHCTGFTEHFLHYGEFTPGLPPALLRTAYTFTEHFGLEFGALDIVSDDSGNFFVIDANTTPGLGQPLQDRIAFLRAPWET